MSSIAIIIPAKNEAGNIQKLIQGIREAVDSHVSDSYEIVVMDDSSDNTTELAQQAGARVVKGRGLGLAQAVLDGVGVTDSDYIIVMDADLQHPPSLLPDITDKLRRYDLVVVTKHAKGAKDELSASRKLQSYLGVLTAHKLIPAPISDPMSGFFGVRRKCLDGVDLEAIGFKIGLEIMVKAKWVSHYELPMKFNKREVGMSKGTAHSLQKHLYHLWQYHLEHKIELPKGSEEYYYFYEGTDWQKEWKQSIALVLQDATRSLGTKKLLDCGCGSSPNINYMYGDKTGVDINVKALEFMRHHSDAQFHEGSVLSIPFPENSFDTVSCIEVLEHLYPEQVDMALSEITRVLQPNGYAILATPNYSSILWNIVENAQKLLQPGHWTSDHHTKFDRESLKAICSNHGLKEIQYNGVMKNMDMVVTYRRV